MVRQNCSVTAGEIVRFSTTTSHWNIGIMEQQQKSVISGIIRQFKPHYRPTLDG
jgi:hypothetical protein